MAEVDDNQIDAPLIANFTHQIINPLNGVVGSIDNVVDGTVPESKKLQKLKQVEAQLSHTIELVRNLAYLSQLTTEAGRKSLRDTTKRSVVPEIVIEAAMFFQELASDKGMKIELLNPVDQFVVKGHRDLLRQVFTNLLENAVKYGHKNTNIEIDTRVQKRTNALIVEVSNYGVGFLNSDAGKLFERGYRGDEAKNIAASGSGIGLYLCKEIIESAFEGTIEAEYDNKNNKSTFRMRFNKYSLEERRRGNHV